jgi:WD40 repeat protein
MATSIRGANPYVGPRSFRRGEQIYGRDREVDQIINLIVAERIVLLYSPSGAGKTSLIQASLIPRLLALRFRVRHVIRVNLNPATAPEDNPEYNRYIFSALLSLEEEIPANQKIPPERLASMSLQEYLEERINMDGTRGVEVLIFDQFEEILSLDPTDQDAKREFFRQVGETLEAANCWALFSMREDLVTALDPYLLLVPSRFSNTFRLDLLGIQAARQAIQQPAHHAGVEFEDAAVEKLVDDLRRVRVQRPDGKTEMQLGPYIEPVQLQVVCYRLWDLLESTNRWIKEEDLASFGEVDQSLAEYYAECVSVAAMETGTRERSIREWFDQKLITEQGLRGTVQMGLKRNNELDQRTIWLLIDAHLVRAEKRGGATWFELAHDRLIGPVRANNTAWFKDNLSMLQNQAAVWDQQGRPERLLLHGKDLVEAEDWASAHLDELTTAEVEFLHANGLLYERERRARRLSHLITFLGIVSMVLAVVASLAYLQAQRQTRLARTGLLASQSQASLEKFPQRGLLLAIEANSILKRGDPSVSAAEETLRAALADPHGLLLSGHENDVVMLAFSPDGRWLATASNDTNNAAVRLWDLNAEELGAEALILGNLGHQVTALAFSPDGRWLATASDGSSGVTVRLWDLAADNSPIEVNTLYGHLAPITSLAFSPHGRWLASGSIDTKTLLWDLQSGTLDNPHQLVGHPGTVLAMDFSPDGRWLATGSLDGMVLLWDLRAENPAEQGLPLRSHTRQVTSLVFSQDGHYLASSSGDGTARLWDLESEGATGNYLELRGHEGEVIALAFSPNGRWLVTGSTDGSANLWDLQAGDPAVNRHILGGHEASVNSLAFSPDGRWLATGSSDHTVRLWQPDMVERIKDALVLRGHDDQVTALAFSPDGRWLATGSFDNSARLWDLGNTNPTTNPIALHDHGDQVTSLAFSRDGHWLASASKDTTTQLWDMGARNPAAEREILRGHEASINSLAFSPDGRWLATGSIDATARLWRLGAEDPAARAVILRGHGRWITTLAFSPDGRWLATGSGDSTVRLWDLDAADPNVNYLELRGHEDEVTTLAFSSDGHWLATGSTDRTVILWDLQARNPAAEREILHGHEASINSLAFSPDGRWLATASSDWTIRLWLLSLDELIHLACQNAGRNLSQQEWQLYFPRENYRKTCNQWPEEH